MFKLRFLRELGRLPRRAASSHATYNDFLLHRILREDWTPLERACIDKEHAKLFASALCPGLKTAETRAVFHLPDAAAAARLVAALQARSGRAEVAKPTHGSGSVLFLRRCPGQDEIRAFVDAATRDFRILSRESQYEGLERKVIVEQDLSAGEAPPADYKFFCSHGEVLFCEVVTGRFVNYRRHLVMPDFRQAVSPGRKGGSKELPPPPGNLAELLQVAQRLSQPFRFVRVDLYAVGGQACLGEFTFVPHAATGALVSEDHGRAVMARIRARRAAWEGEGNEGLAGRGAPAAPAI